MVFKGCFPQIEQFNFLLQTALQSKFYIFLFIFPLLQVPKYSQLFKLCLQIIIQRLNQNLHLEDHGFAFVF